MRDADAAGIVAAEAFEAGASGLEEKEDEVGSAVSLIIYAPAASANAVHAAVAAAPGILTVGEIEVCAATDWSAAWRAGLTAIVVSDELLVRPSFLRHPLLPGQSELEIDPGQAFGTGGHESTRLALDLLAGLPRAAREGARVLDVGTGSGVLALAALRLGAVAAVGIDVDPVAVSVAGENALRNGLGERLRLVTGSLDVLGPQQFNLVVANLLKRELLPIRDEVVRRVGSRGRLLLSGLLATEEAEVLASFHRLGLRRTGARTRCDASGTEWIGLELAR